MTKKTKVTQREVWLLALLPAALVLIVSMSIPGPGDEREQVEQRLEKAQSADARSRRQARREKLEGELAETRAELERVQLEQAGAARTSRSSSGRRTSRSKDPRRSAPSLSPWTS